MNPIKSSSLMSLFFFWLLIVLLPSTVFSGDPPAAGDWIITDTTSIENQNIILTGNLIVEAGGSLILNNVVLALNAAYDGQYGIIVNPGGSMVIDNSSVSSADNHHAFRFTVNGSLFEMLSSELHDCGWGPDSENLGDDGTILSGDRGLVVTTTGAVIQGNTFSNNHIGIILAGNEIRLDNNSIHTNKVHGIYGHANMTCEVINNTIQHETVGSPVRMRDAKNNKILSNTITSSIHRGVLELGWGSSGNQIVGNKISGLGVAILLMFGSNNNSIKNNILSTDECGIQIWGWNHLVEGNTISNADEGIHTGIYAIYAYNSVINENNISDVNAENGIFLRHSSNNKIANNSIQAIRDLEPSHSSGILLINSSKNNIIGGNDISNFSRGLSILYNSDGNTVIGNELRSSKLQNIIVDNSEDNAIYNNNFMDNIRPPYDSGDNKWFLSGKGNYWSDYSGPDEDNDSIGDDPYNIQPDGIDRFPLKTPALIESIEISDPATAAPPSSDAIFSKTVAGAESVEDQTLNLGFISVLGGAKLTLRNVEFITGMVDGASGLQVQGNGELFMDNCKFTHIENGYGFQFYVWPSGAKITVKNSEFNGVGHEWACGGIQIYSAAVVFENNTLINSPISFSDCPSVSLVGNTFLNNYSAISLGSSNNSLIQNNIIEGSLREAVTIQASDNTSVIENTIKNIWKDGIFAYWCSNNIIDKNNILGMNNDFIAIQLGGNNDLANQNIISNFSTGIRMGELQTASENKISNCSIGIDMSWNDSKVESNKISGCTTGINVSGQNQELSGNTISDNITGLNSGMANECTIIHNNFINNETQAQESNPGNFWDKGLSVGGNYWSDYSGVDKNEDGIGDTSQNIDCCGVDHFPLVLPVGFGINATKPKANITNVPIDTSIAVTFDKPMDTSSFTSKTFYMTDAAGPISGTIEFSGNTAVISPANDLGYNTTYTATLTTGIEDMAGNPMLADFSWSFTTQTEPDTTPPAVSTTHPENNAVDVAADTNIVVTFTETINPSSLSSSTFFINDGKDNISGTISCNGPTASFTPGTDLKYDTTYTVTLTAGIEDITGNATLSNYTWSFTTQTEPDTIPPAVSTTHPGNNATDVAVNTNIMVTFTETINPSSLTSSTFFINDGVDNISCTISCNGPTASFNLSTDLEYETTYTVTLTAGIEDIEGNATLSDYIWSFTTKSDENKNGQNDNGGGGGGGCFIDSLRY